MAYPRKASPELLARIERVCRMRIAAEAIPSDHEIAMEYGVNERLVSRWMSRVRKAIVRGGRPQGCTATAFHVEHSSSLK